MWKTCMQKCTLKSRSREGIIIIVVITQSMSWSAGQDSWSQSVDLFNFLLLFVICNKFACLKMQRWQHDPWSKVTILEYIITNHLTAATAAAMQCNRRYLVQIQSTFFFFSIFCGVSCARVVLVFFDFYFFYFNKYR